MRLIAPVVGVGRARRAVDVRRRAIAGAVALLFAGGGPALRAQAAVDLDTPFVTTSQNVLALMLDLAQIKPGERLIDLGSGDGRIVIAAAKRGADALGIEIDPALVAQSRERARREGVEARAQFRTEDLFQTDFSRADIVTMYLLPDVNAKLRPRLFETLRPGARIISHDYDLGGWPPDASYTIDVPDKPVNANKQSVVHYWRVPARIAGRWRGTTAGQPASLQIAQDYQRVSGTLQLADRSLRFDGARVDGPSLTLRFDTGQQPGLTLTLQASDGQLSGTLREGTAAPRPVSFSRSAAS